VYRNRIVHLALRRTTHFAERLAASPNRGFTAKETGAVVDAVGCLALRSRKQLEFSIAALWRQVAEINLKWKASWQDFDNLLHSPPGEKGLELTDNEVVA
jgi:hypothetical protein